ncbi:Cation efflux family [Rhizoctonia solani]|uniref:Cation efflux family n=1 Tax=Rhizoctonia solani TaxID=456999 RepID=A0A8H7I351_9AGAM|nr:Cation efflux family [Rhizoctonia solani]
MTSLGAASVPSYVERARSRRTISMLGDLEANRTKDVFEVPYPPWSQTYTKSNEELASIKNKAVREFYEKQNQTLAKFEEVDQLLSGELVHHVLYSFENPSESTRLLSPENSISKREKDKERLSAFGLTVINTNLFLGKGVAVLLSGSVSIWASFVDSFMVSLSLVLKGREIKGGRRFVFQLIETPGAEIGRSAVSNRETKNGAIGSRHILWFVGVLDLHNYLLVSTPSTYTSDILNFVTGVEGCKRLLSGSREEFSLDKTTIAIMVVTIATKTVAWLLSAQIKSNGVQALAQDNKNDVFFTTFSVIFPGLAGATNLPWLDPLGGIILSLYIIIEWTETLMLNFRQLSGRAADPDEYQRMLYLITRFTTLKYPISKCTTQAQNSSARPTSSSHKQTSFEEVHNVSEAIQVALECLEDVNRAYIHADFTVLNPASHVRRIS